MASPNRRLRTKAEFDELNRINKLALSNAVSLHHNQLWLPDPDVHEFIDLDNRSCFDILIAECDYDLPDPRFKFEEDDEIFPATYTSCKKISLSPNQLQKTIISLWFSATTEMYNETVRYIKSKIKFNHLKVIRNLNKQISEIKPVLEVFTNRLKKHKTEKNRLSRYINTDRIRTPKNVSTYNEKMISYVEAKEEIKVMNFHIKDNQDKLNSLEKQLKEIYFKINRLFDYTHLRTHCLKDKRDELRIKYIYKNDQTTKIPAHVMDCAIKAACASFKSGKTKYLRYQINSFKVRYLKQTRKKKVMEIEPKLITKGTFCNVALGKMKMKYKTRGKWGVYNLDSKKAIKLHYDSKKNEYSLFVPETHDTQDNNLCDNTYIGIDPGIRTCMTGVTDEGAFKIGTNLSPQIEKLHQQIDRTNASNKTKERKAEINAKRYRRIDNIVNEMHWKSINYMTQKSNKIFIGDFKVQKAISGDSPLAAMTKRVGQSMKHYQFKQRLQYKCSTKRIKSKIVDERFTSKTCSNCGAYDKDLGGKKIYECHECEKKIDRDINGSRCILMKNME